MALARVDERVCENTLISANVIKTVAVFTLSNFFKVVFFRIIRTICSSGDMALTVFQALL